MKINIKMYCLGTGDCLLYTFEKSDGTLFKMMTDFGSCVGKREDFLPFMHQIKKDIGNKLDLLVITHEHNDHVNGFAKCPEIFDEIEIKRAWFSWTENREDPTGNIKVLLEKRKKLKKSVASAFDKLSFKHNHLTEGMESLVHENLPIDEEDKLIKNDTDAYYSLPGYIKIKEILVNKNVKIEYMEPGTIHEIQEIGLKFYILGPPIDRANMYKHEKVGRDVYEKSFGFFDKDLEENAFTRVLSSKNFDNLVPFNLKYVMYENEKQLSVESNIVSTDNSKEAKLSSSDEEELRNKRYFHKVYHEKKNDWRKIDEEYLNSSGQLALRLNSHINNTSLAMAVEIVEKKKVMLLPGDAEFGSWQSWHEIEKWKYNNRTFSFKVTDLFARTFFYKVSHHLSFNGTPTNLGINLIENEDLVSMATLDLERISKKWKGTMPNKSLIRDLGKTGQRELIIMNTKGIEDMEQLEKRLSDTKFRIFKNGDSVLFKEYVFNFLSN